MKALGDLYPDTKFVCFTKRFDLDYSRLPKNLKIFFSLWPGMSLPKFPRNVHKAWTQDGTETRMSKKVRECPGSCTGCMTCWEGADVLFHLHR